MNTVNNDSNPYAPPKAAVHDVAATTEQEAAGRGTRLGAAIVDTIIIVVAVWLPMFALGTFRYEGGEMVPGNLMGPGTIIAVVLAIAWIIITIRLVKANGQTIAKKLFGIKVVRKDGSPISLARIFWLRNVVNAIPSAIPLIGGVYGLVDSLMIFGEKRQCLHDRIADTIVVKA